MIQRIQTVYLLLGAVALVAMFFFDALWQHPALIGFAWFGPAVIALGGLAAMVAVAAVFLYRNRTQQLRAVIWAQILTVLCLAVLYGSLFAADAFPSLTEAATGLIISVLLPVVAYVLFLLARRGVIKDIELVRSMDRLR